MAAGAWRICACGALLLLAVLPPPAFGISAALPPPTLRIQPERGGSRRHMPLGHTFALTCGLAAGGGGGNASIWWENQQNNTIYGEAGVSSIYTSSLSTGAASGPAVSLVFNEATQFDQGMYRCCGKDAAGRELEPAYVDISLFTPAKFRETAGVVGAKVNRTVQINCGADGDPPPRIRVKMKNSDTMPSNYIETESVVNVESVQPADHNRTVVCLAMQVFRDQGTTHVTTRTVDIHVYTDPVLNASLASVRAIVGRSAALRCHATSDFPPVLQFLFYKAAGGDHIGRADRNPPAAQYAGVGAGARNAKYRVATDWDNGWAELKIANLSESDLGDYTCMARTIQTSSKMNINVAQAAPPAQPTAAFLRSDGRSITWRLGVPYAQPDVPLVGYNVSYLRAEFVDDLAEDLAGAHLPMDGESDYNKKLWVYAAIKTFLPVAPSGEYVVPGLEPAVDYVFRIGAVNVAGAGELIEIAAKTADGGKL